MHKQARDASRDSGGSDNPTKPKEGSQEAGGKGSGLLHPEEEPKAKKGRLNLVITGQG
jgi:hypothetical protein